MHRQLPPIDEQNHSFFKDDEEFDEMTVPELKYFSEEDKRKSSRKRKWDDLNEGNRYVFSNSGELIPEEVKPFEYQGKTYIFNHQFFPMPDIRGPLVIENVFLEMMLIREVMPLSEFLNRTYIKESSGQVVDHEEKQNLFFDKQKNTLMLDNDIVLPTSSFVYTDNTPVPTIADIKKRKTGNVLADQNNRFVLSQKKFWDIIFALDLHFSEAKANFDTILSLANHNPSYQPTLFKMNQSTSSMLQNPSEDKVIPKRQDPSKGF